MTENNNTAMISEKKSNFMNKLRKYWPFYLLFLPCAIGLIMFCYVPMGGVILSFKEYIPKLGVYGSPFAQPFTKWFDKLFEDPYFWDVLWNTVIVSLLRLAFGFPFPIILAILFNELKSKGFGKFVQTILFLPYFISWIVLSGIVKMIFGVDGLVNSMLASIGVAKVSFLTTSAPFLILLIVIGIWKDAGYGMIIYLASISSIDQGLYEAVEIDGGNRWHKMIHITLPGIASAIAIQLILSLSGILNGGFDQIYNLYSTPVYDVADILDTYLYRVGLADQKYELGTALGLFKSAIGLVLVLLSNWATKLLGGEGIW